MTVITRVRTVPDTDPATRLIVGIDGEGWNIPLAAGESSANPHVRELVTEPDGTQHERGWHSYVMLAAADGAGRRESVMHDGSRCEAEPGRARNYGLLTEQTLEFILSQPDDALITGFYFSYDSIKLAADMPEENLRELAKEDTITQDEYDLRVKKIAVDTGLSIRVIHDSRLVRSASTVYNGYWVHFVPRKSLEVIDILAGRETTRNRYWHKTAEKWVTEPMARARPRWKRQAIVWDVYGFFQSSFIRTLRAYRCGKCGGCAADPKTHCLTAPWSPADLDHIERMKENRGEFKPDQQAEILDYCYRECEYLVFLVRDLLVNIGGFGLTLTRYDGSGAVASAWMKRERIQDYLPVRTMAEDEITLTPSFEYSGLPERVMLCGYFGGRFEISEIGFMGSLYGYDINSAYPSVTRSLPCLAHGHFRRVSEYVPGMFGIYLAGSQTSGRWAPFPFRTDETTGTRGIVKDAIYYAHGGRRWIWGHADPALSEIGIARERFGPEAIPVHDGYVWEPECNHKPFRMVGPMYVERQEFVKNGLGLEKVIKLILNSIYGKLAQSVGWKLDKRGQPVPPVTQCFIWAGLITSGCRAMILDAITRPGADVVSIATDGILSRTEINLRHTPGQKILGEWDADNVTYAYLFQSGVYTFTNIKGKPVYKTRGFAAKEIPAQALINAWNTGEVTVKADPGQSRFITMRGGVARTDALEYIGQWVPSEHDVSFTHNRRLPIPPEPGPGEVPDFLGLCPLSEPCVIPGERVSVPYTPKQNWDEVMEHVLPAEDAEFMDA
jgi:hypothetical protein